MKGKPEVLKVLQEALTDELGAVHGYILHAEMCESWGYKTLAGDTTKRAIEEMKHAEKLISRMLFLEGAPDVQSLPKIHIGKDVEEQMAIGLKDETGAIASYNQGSRHLHQGRRQCLGGIAEGQSARRGAARRLPGNSTEPHQATGLGELPGPEPDGVSFLPGRKDFLSPRVMPGRKRGAWRWGSSQSPGVSPGDSLQCPFKRGEVRVLADNDLQNAVVRVRGGVGHPG